MDFKQPTLSDKAWVTQIMQTSGKMGCEYCFGNLFLWSPVYGNTIASYDGLLLARDGGKTPSYLYPCGKGDKKSAIKKLLDYAKNDDVPFTLYSLNREDKAELEALFPEQFTFTPTREYFDYIYNTEDLINLAGRKYHGKRNHIAYFKKQFDWSYERITERNLADCFEMNRQWELLNRSKNPEELDAEFSAIRRGFDHFFELGFTGGVLRVQGEIVAYTLGEAINSSVFCTHIEKAFGNIRGAYPTINREFAAQSLNTYRYINREEDTGSEGLRKAKLSYYPAILLEKYNATYKG